MADHQRAVQLLTRNIAVEIGDDAVEYARLQIGPGIIPAKTVDLHQDDAVGLGQFGCNIVPHRARGGEAGDQDHRTALAHGDDRNVRQA